MKDIPLTPSQRRIIIALIAGDTVQGHATRTERSEMAVNQDICRARAKNGLTTHQLVARLAAEMVRAEIERS